MFFVLTRCSDGYYGYPNCVPCDCDVNGTEGSICTVVSGVCPCKLNYAGQRCDQCAPGYYNFQTVFVSMKQEKDCYKKKSLKVFCSILCLYLLVT